MKSYGQFCPVAKAAELFCERWTALVVRDMAQGACRFSEIHKGVPLMSPTMLSRRLKQLEAEGVVTKRRDGAGRGRASYHLTRAGREFVPLVEALGVWGQRWSRRQLAEHEVDLGLVVWSLESGTDPEAFGPDRSLVRMEFPEQPAGKQLWWFVGEQGRTHLCLEDPGHDVDLYLRCTLVDMTYILRGDLKVAQALQTGRLEAIGSLAARRALEAWFNLGPVTKVASMRQDVPAF